MGGGGGVDQQKAALKLLNTPSIASNCVQLRFYNICVSFVLDLYYISTSSSMMKLAEHTHHSTQITTHLLFPIYNIRATFVQ